MTSWRYIDGIFFAWENGKETLKKTIEKLNTSHPIINLLLNAQGKYKLFRCTYKISRWRAHGRFVC